MLTNSTVLLIGAGRLAKHLKYWNSTLQKPHSLLQWDRSQSLDLLQKYISESGAVWLAISDSALVPFYEANLAGRSIKIVHFSGALSDSRLIGAHPLMSFSNELFPTDIYPKIHFVINNTSDLQEALPGFTNSFSKLEAHDKAVYHALCVLAGNFPQLLWNETLKEMKALNIPTAALDLYIKQISQNFIDQKEKSFTGPLVRNDLTTIDKNISALSRNEKLQNIYKIFFKEFRP